MGLDAYNRKRDFRKTAEPKGRRGRSAGGRIFVVQQHAARRLHFDFRLEWDGVLKSWAVPKGPSTDPADKRLAVQTEDHPVDYASFEGHIAAGEYGAGTVQLWDAGTWTPASRKVSFDGNRIKFRLSGRKLRGAWTLARMTGRGGGEGKNWLLIKGNDETAQRRRDLLAEAPESVKSGLTIDDLANGNGDTASVARRKRNAKRRTAQPDAGRPPSRPIAPELATLVDRVPQGADWWHEIKYDGYRLIARIDGKSARLQTRRGQDWTDHFPAIAAAVGALRAKETVLDGELIVQRPDGTADFQALQNSLKSRRPAPLVYYVFDILIANGRDVRSRPLRERKAALKRTLETLPAAARRRVRLGGEVKGNGDAVFKRACAMGIEGIVSKRPDSPYLGKRTTDWVKVKCLKRQEFVIAGFTDPKGGRRYFGSLLLGYYKDGKLRYAGHVGTGFSDRTLKEVHGELQRRRTDANPFAGPVDDALRRTVHWIRPDLLAEVAYGGWTDSGVLRHPSFVGLRMDKAAAEVTRERPAPLTNLADSPARGRRRRPEGGEPVMVAGVELTHPQRIVYPEQGVSKLDICRYYEAVGDRILPHVAGRPLSLVRCPRGRSEKCFFQKHLTDAPPEIGSVSIREKETVRTYATVRDLKGLIALVQLGVLEFHVWGSRADAVERPDLMVLDIDPGPGAERASIIEAAFRIKDVFDGYGVRSYVRTTGGKGLHVVAPFKPAWDWSAFKEASRAIAETLRRRDPARYTTSLSKSKRTGRLFIDYLRNGRGATSVATFSTRARPGAPVSFPLRWSELKPDLRFESFNVRTVPGLQAGRSDPWAGFLRRAATPSRLRG